MHTHINQTFKPTWITIKDVDFEQSREGIKKGSRYKAEHEHRNGEPSNSYWIGSVLIDSNQVEISK